MGKHVPDVAWAVLEGDDRKVTKSLKRLNLEEIAGQRRLPFEPRNETGALRDAMRAVGAGPGHGRRRLGPRSSEGGRRLLASQAHEHEKLVADAWCAAFLWPKAEPGPAAEAAPTTAAWRALRDQDAPPSPGARRDHAAHRRGLRPLPLGAGVSADPCARRLRRRARQPAWERVKLQEQEFFARRDPVIANARNAAERKKLIAALPFTNPVLWREWTNATRIAQGQSHFVRQSGRYRLCGKGDVNTYALFAEHNWSVAGASRSRGVHRAERDRHGRYHQGVFSGSSRRQRPCRCPSLRKRESHLQRPRPQVSVRAPDDRGVPSGRPRLLCAARGRSRRPAAALRADSRRFRHAQPEHAHLSHVQVTSRRRRQLGDVSPGGRVLAGGRPGRESMGREIPAHVRHGQRLRPVSHAGRTWRRPGGGWKATGSRRTERSCCLCTRPR